MLGSDSTVTFLYSTVQSSAIIVVIFFFHSFSVSRDLEITGKTSSSFLEWLVGGLEGEGGGCWVSIGVKVGGGGGGAHAKTRLFSLRAG